MGESIYIETTITSYLAARPSHDVINNANQIVTQDWWETQRARFELYTSELVVIESSAGDPAAAQRRLAFLSGLPLLSAGNDAAELSSALIAAAAVPPNSARDALHVAIAATNGMDYLLTWNCTHLANALLQHKIVEVCVVHGVRPPIITTPNHLFDEEYHERRERELD